jgi:uncharacterized protein (TIGR03083 family)
VCPARFGARPSQPSRDLRGGANDAGARRLALASLIEHGRGMDDDRLWALVSAERQDVLELLEDLRTAEWNAPSLCAGWRVRDVVGHLTMATDTPLSSAVVGLVRAGFDVDRFLARTAVQRGSAPLPALLSGWQRAVDSRRTPPGGTAGQMLVEAVSHHQDVVRPLGRPPTTPPERLTCALDTAVRLGGPFRSRQRATGLRLVAPELDWTAGDAGAPEVRGRGDVLLLGLLGRTEALGELSGDGLDRWR